MSTSYRLATLFIACLAPFGGAQTVLEYWHSQNAAQSTVGALADGFNALQSEYALVPRYVGNHQEEAYYLDTQNAAVNLSSTDLTPLGLGVRVLF